MRAQALDFRLSLSATTRRGSNHPAKAAILAMKTIR
jgi:hypothetical protein